MATNFPTGLDSLTNPTSSDSLASPSHSSQHANANDAIEALQAKVGADSSAVTSSLDYKLAQLEAASTGKILQVVSAAKTDTQSASLTTGAFADITDLNISLTCSSASSKVLLIGSITGGWSPNPNNNFRWRFTAGGTAVGVGAAAGSRVPVSAFGYGEGGQVDPKTVAFLYSPSSTSAITYSVEFGHDGTGTYTVYINRGQTYTDSATYHSYISTLTAMEVSA